MIWLFDLAAIHLGVDVLSSLDHSVIFRGHSICLSRPSSFLLLALEGNLLKRYLFVFISLFNIALEVDLPQVSVVLTKVFWNCRILWLKGFTDECFVHSKERTEAV